MLANTTGGGFESTSPAMTSDLLDEVCEEIRLSARGHAVDTRIGRIFERSQAFVAGRSSPADDEIAGGSLCFACLDAREAAVHSLGGDEAWFFEGAQLKARTKGHTLARESGFASAPDVLTSGLGFGRRRTESLVRPREQGLERLVLLSRGAVRTLQQRDVVEAVGAAGSPQDVADALTRKLGERSSKSFGTVLVAQL
jgi:hypothetical protein